MKKIQLPSNVSFCGKIFKNNKWWTHLNKCDKCKTEYESYCNDIILKWNKLCECGCGNITNYGKKRINGHGAKGAKRTLEQKNNYKNSWTDKRRKEKSIYWKNNNPMYNTNLVSKIKQTNLERYGTENVFASEKIKNEIKIKHPNKQKECVNKIKKTKLKRYGNENYNNINKFKQTCIKKYGVDNPHKNKKIIEKSINTYTEKLASGKITIKNNWKTGYYIKTDGSKEWFDSSLEEKRMKYYDKNDLIWTKKHKIRIPYINENGINTYYVPDFLINNNIIEEVKGWLKKDDIIKAKIAKKYCKENNLKYNFLLGNDFNIIQELST